MEKGLYKIEVFLLKIIPYILAVLQLLSTMINCFGIELFIFPALGYISIIPMVFLYLSSYVFKFCSYHRLPLHYIIVNNTLNWLDYKFTFNITDYAFLATHSVIAGIFILLVVYFKKQKMSRRQLMGGVE